MKAETKFNPGDKVYIMYHNHIALFTVHSVRLYLGKGDVHPTINYALTCYDEETNRDEKEVFSTRDEITNFLHENLY